ncbi:MAG: hypothetical protein KA210_05060 [Bacteroidia bacterium]|jgi:hypothetical protein|nr:hypothetical protein [Bacteroidia bacterium]
MKKRIKNNTNDISMLKHEYNLEKLLNSRRLAFFLSISFLILAIFDFSKVGLIAYGFLSLVHACIVLMFTKLIKNEKN